MKYPSVSNFINGNSEKVNGENIDVLSPVDGSILSTVPISNAEAVDRAVKSAQKAFPKWSS